MKTFVLLSRPAFAVMTAALLLMLANGCSTNPHPRLVAATPAPGTAPQ